jgi:hypothetical protein
LLAAITASWLTPAPSATATNPSLSAQGQLCASVADDAAQESTRVANEDWISILSGTLDDSELAPPQGHYGIESWISWLKIEDNLKKECTEEIKGS